MTPEQKAAVERLRQVQQNLERGDVAWCSRVYDPEYNIDAKGDYSRDMETIVSAYLAEHPADDDELIDVDWLKGLSSRGGQKLSMLAVRLVGDKFHLMSPGRVTEGIEGLRDYVSPSPATRGDVRRLCAALGINLNERRTT